MDTSIGLREPGLLGCFIAATVIQGDEPLGKGARLRFGSGDRHRGHKQMPTSNRTTGVDLYVSV